MAQDEGLAQDVFHCNVDGAMSCRGEEGHGSADVPALVRWTRLDPWARAAGALNESAITR